VKIWLEVALNATESPKFQTHYTLYFFQIKATEEILVAEMMGRLKTREWKTRERQKCRNGKRGSGILGTKQQGWKTREWKSWHQNRGVENAR